MTNPFVFKQTGTRAHAFSDKVQYNPEEEVHGTVPHWQPGPSLAINPLVFEQCGTIAHEFSDKVQ